MLMHSTLEEAWGKQHTRLRSYKEPKDVNVSLKNRKSKQSFEKSNKLTANNKRYKNMMLMDDEDYDNGMLKDPDERYYGYPDSRSFSRTRPVKSKSKSRRIRINPKRNEYVDAEDDSDIEPVDIDDESVDEEVLEEDADNANEYIFEEVYEEDEDNYLAESLRQKEKEQRRRNFDKKDPVVEEEQEERTQWKPLRPKNLPSHDLNQILDLSIYTLSGILLIVILEQFVQLGLKLKSFKPPRP